MKKYFKYVFILLMMFIGYGNVYAATPTLKDVENKFNNNPTVLEYAQMGSVWKATASSNNLNITTTAGGTTSSFNFSFKNNILTGNFASKDAFGGLMVSMTLVDSIGQLHGYEDGELSKALQGDIVSEYSIEDEGFEMIQTESGDVTIKIDISKKIPLEPKGGSIFDNISGNSCKEYIDVDDLDFSKRFIAGEGFAQFQEGYLVFYKDDLNNLKVITIGEEDKMSSCTYNTILSALEIMFDSKKAVNYFKDNYPAISGNKEFTGIKIELNPNDDDFDYEEDYKYIKLTINVDEVKVAMADYSDLDTNSSQGFKFDLTSTPTLVSVVVIMICVFLLCINRKNNA